MPNNTEKAIIAIMCTVVIIFNAYNAWEENMNKSFVDELYNSRQKELYFRSLENYYNLVNDNIYKNTVISSELLRIFATINIFLRKTPDERINTFDETLKNIIFQFNDAMEYINEVGELSSVALYLYDDKNNNLRDYISKKTRLMFKGQRGRDWDVSSESHIAHTYRSKHYHVFYDLRMITPKIEEKFTKPHDEDLYRASITYPLFFGDKNNEIRGVFCLTSSLAGVFGKNEVDTYEQAEKNQLLGTKQNMFFAIAIALNILLNETFPASNNVMIEKIEKEKIK